MQNVKRIINIIQSKDAVLNYNYANLIRCFLWHKQLKYRLFLHRNLANEGCQTDNIEHIQRELNNVIAVCFIVICLYIETGKILLNDALVTKIVVQPADQSLEA